MAAREGWSWVAQQGGPTLQRVYLRTGEWDWGRGVEQEDWKFKVAAAD